MCIAAVKWFPKVGWIGIKNRDRAYKPEIKIKQSFSKGVERLMLWDSKTHWTEGLNEYGIAILSSATAVKEDEAEADINTDNVGNVINNNVNTSDGYSMDGLIIRKALFGKTLDEVKDLCIELKLVGNTYIFNKDKCYLIESGHHTSIQGRPDEKYEYKIKTIDKDKVSCRTNHGLDLEWNGYQFGSNDEHRNIARKSSEIRYKKTIKALKKVKEPEDMLGAISDTSSDKDGQMNPIRTAKTHGSSILVTTGQIQIIPSERLLSYRPIWCTIAFDFDKIDSPKSKTYFEVISKRNLITIEESFDDIILNKYKELIND